MTKVALDKMDAPVVTAGIAGVALAGLLLKKAFPAKKSGPQVVLLSGASSGIGKAAALQLIQDGHVVYGAARRVDKMQDLVDAGGHAIAMDVSKPDQIVAAVNRIIKEQGRIDVLINNAGDAVYGAVEDVSMEDARRQFDVNLFGLARLTQEVLPHMRKAGSGCIMVTSSMGGKIYTPFGAWYHATKHALEGWSDCLRLELKQFNINVVIIEPGAIKTEFGDVMSQPLLDRSKGGPYEATVQKFVDAGESSFPMSDPSVISNVISQAVVLKNPPRRYLVGSMAKPLVFIRNWFGDGFYDMMMLQSLK